MKKLRHGAKTYHPFFIRIQYPDLFKRARFVSHEGTLNKKIALILILITPLPKQYSDISSSWPVGYQAFYSSVFTGLLPMYTFQSYDKHWQTRSCTFRHRRLGCVGRWFRFRLRCRLVGYSGTIQRILGLPNELEWHSTWQFSQSSELFLSRWIRRYPRFC